MQSLQGSLLDNINELEESDKPKKCPVCNGSGCRNEAFPFMFDCVYCDGRGFVDHSYY